MSSLYNSVHDLSRATLEIGEVLFANLPPSNWLSVSTGSLPPVSKPVFPDTTKMLL